MTARNGRCTALVDKHWHLCGQPARDSYCDWHLDRFQRGEARLSRVPWYLRLFGQNRSR